MLQIATISDYPLDSISLYTFNQYLNKIVCGLFKMTFKEIYEKTVKENRSKGIKPNWWMSRASGRGSDVVNQSAVRDAVELGRITNAQALVLLPNFIAQENKTPQLPQNNSIQTLIGSTFNKMDAV